MNDNDGVYILKTRGALGTYEFRVANVGCIDNITCQPDYPEEKPVFDRQLVLHYFGTAEVLNNYPCARQVAEKMFDEIFKTLGLTPRHGIEVLDYRHIPFPTRQTASV